MATVARVTNLKSVMWFTVELRVGEGVRPCIWQFADTEHDKAMDLADKLVYSGTPMTNEYTSHGGVVVNVIAWSGHPTNEAAFGIILKQIGGGE